jgi:hypothetical protein
MCRFILTDGLTLPHRFGPAGCLCVRTHGSTLLVGTDLLL